MSYRAFARALAGTTALCALAAAPAGAAPFCAPAAAQAPALVASSGASALAALMQTRPRPLPQRPQTPTRPMTPTPRPTPPPTPPHGDYEPCCPPWDGKRLKSLLHVAENKDVNNKVDFEYKYTSPQANMLNTQMNAYVNYAKTLNPAITHVNLTLWWANCNQTTVPPGPLSGPCTLVGPQFQIRWDGSGNPGYFLSGTNSSVSPTMIFKNSSHAGTTNNRYRLMGFMHNNLDPLKTGCEIAVVDYNVTVGTFKQAPDGSPAPAEGQVIPMDQLNPEQFQVDPELRRQLEREEEERRSRTRRDPGARY